MKIKRYIHGQTNIDQLESARRSIISPQKMAGLTAAPYEAFERAGRGIAEDMLRVQMHEKKLQRQADYRQQQLMDVGIQAAYAEHIRDPRWEKGSQPNGEPTSTTMRKEWQEKVQRMADEGMPKFNDPETAAFYGEKWKLITQKMDAFLGEEINKKMDAWDEEALVSLYNISLEGKDFAFAAKMAGELLDKGRISPAEHRSLMKTIKLEKREFDSDLVLDAYRNADDKEAFFREIVENPDPDEDLQERVVAKIKGEIANVDRAESDSKTIAASQLNMEKGDILDRIHNEPGYDPLPDALALYDEMVALDPAFAKEASNWVNQIKSAMRSKIAGTGDALQYRSLREGDQLIDDTQAMREQYDAELRDKIQAEINQNGEITPQKAFDIEVQLTKDTGIIGDVRSRSMARSISDPRFLAQEANFWSRITDDPTFSVRTSKVPKEAQIMLQATASRGRSGMSINESAALTIQRANMEDREPDLTKKRMAEFRSKSVKRETDRRINEMLDSSYNKFAWFNADRPNEEDDHLRYRVYLEDAFVLLGDMQDAYDAADAYFRNSHAMTKINGEWEVMYNGMEGDWDTLRINYFDELKSGQYLVQRVDGTYAAENLEDLEDFQLRNPHYSGGKKVFDVFYRGQPLMEDTEQGRFMVRYSASPADLRKADMHKAKLEAMDKIEDIGEDFINAHNAIKAGTPYDWQEDRETVRTAPALIEAEAENIEIARTKAQERYPDINE